MRLKRILISESAHLIWALRCDHVIGERTYPISTIRSKWIKKISTRLDIDRQIAKSSRKPNQINKVKNTWKYVIQEQTSELPQDWVTNLEVLVGIKLLRTPA